MPPRTPKRRRAMPRAFRNRKPRPTAHVCEERHMAMNSQHVVWNHHFRAVTLATVLLLIAATATGCGDEAPPTQEARPVRTVTVEGGAEGETVSLTGQIRAKDEVSLAFRIDGRMIERPVHVGDVLSAGQVVARLDPQNQQNELRTAQAELSSA